MILVDVFVPSVNNVYDFQLDENTPVQRVIGEICELIGQKERCGLTGNAEELMLCSRNEKCILPGDCTLMACGVKTGNSLILV
ncbi:hypothetical protein IMSAGC009_04627 [Lachnospiraceae bacterium]|nr:hypothetical protein IMSAGC009_04627 [Lachnospiraceae bacterium]